MRQSDLLPTELLKLAPNDCWRVSDALMHLLVLGTTGSGKTSTTIKYAIKSMLYVGFGLISLTAKSEDAAMFKSLCQQARRSASVIEITDTAGEFNFLAWELARTRNINAVIDLLDHAIDMVRTSGPSQGKLGDEFWSASKTAMLRATIPVIYAATGTVRIDDVLAFIRSAPSSPEQMKDPQWQCQAAFYHLFSMAAARLEAGPIPGFDDAVAARAIAYWRDDISRLDAKTAGNIRITLTTALSRFEHGFLKRMFCSGVSVVPELLFHGAIILLNFPVQVHGEDAAIGQKLWKFCTQRACLSRNALDARQSQIPVGIIADECHNFLHQDAEFLAQCRSSLVSVVFATQSFPTIRAKIGGDAPHDRAEHLISNFNTVVLHSSACPTTNDWFSRKIGKTLQRRGNFSEAHGSSTNYGTSLNEGSNWGTNSSSGGSYSSGGNGGGSSGSNWSHGTSSGGSSGYGKTRGSGTSHNLSQGYAEQMDFMIEAGDFGRMLKTGGTANGNRVSAVLYQSGRQFVASGTNTLMLEYRQ